MHAIIACQMEFQLYPMDIQVCPIYIESCKYIRGALKQLKMYLKLCLQFGNGPIVLIFLKRVNISRKFSLKPIPLVSYSNSKVRLKWSTSGVAVNPELKLLQYNIGTPLELEESDSYMREKEGNFSRLTVYFRFERQIGHHLIQTFAPSSLVVALSWFSFWLGLDAIPGRVTLLVTCMLTLVTMFTGLRADIPPVAYVKVTFQNFWLQILKKIMFLRLWIFGWLVV